jgi:hypothetical protein
MSAIEGMQVTPTTDCGRSVEQPEQSSEVKYQRLLFRSQFTLGRSFIDIIPSAQQLTIRANLLLTAHPDLNIQIAQAKQKRLVLLGFILDPENPQSSNAAIIENLVRNFNHYDDLFLLTARFGGRWILIADDGDKLVLFHDPAGLRQVFYSDLKKTQDLWCGSQSGIIADILGLPKDPEANDFISSPEILTNPEYWWPGDSSPYKELRHLLPNHYLNLQTGTCHRFWPDGNLRPLPATVAVQRCGAHLTGLLESAVNRFELALSLTAGWDSRVLLAASKPIKHRITYFTIKNEATLSIENHPDLAVPRALVGRFGLKHDIIEMPATVDKRFAEIFDRNVTLPHDIWRVDAQAALELYELQKVGVSGSVSEVARHFYVMPRYVERVLTGEKLSSLTGMGKNAFAVQSFNGWIGTLGNPFNLRPLDLFYWEQRAGNWLAMCQNEFDIAWADIFTPYNCRLLMSDMLSVQRKYRLAPTYLFYKELILNLWPEVLDEPINPHKVRSPMQSIKKRVRNQLSNVKHLVLRR